ncbi:diguanylate cyclase [Phreatobacter stygius]|uniref:diguanylate cyclase n=2 Tax=Phreatobacter stygius TaxID=1940610 RepID=A0A4D7BF20_9HYPH|nr:diguanylate cyclase [Phreatobacter stygius]QCI69255.1 diguanylate cyclase [Phreatobacter stygius]
MKRHLPGIAAAFVMLVCGAILAMGALREWSARDQDLRAAEVDAANLVRSLLQHAEDSIELVDNAVIGVVHRLETEGTTPAAMARLQGVLHLRKATMPRLRGLFVYGADGAWLATSEPVDVARFNNSDRDYFAHHRSSTERGAFIGRPVRSRSGGQWIVTVSRRVQTPEGEFAGVVLATVDIAYFETFYSQFDMGKQGSLALIAANGTLLARFPVDDSFIGRDVSASPVVHHAARQTAGTLAFTSALDGIERLSAYRRSERFPLIVVASRGRADVLASWRVAAVERMTFVAGLTMLIAMLGLFLVRQMIERQRMAHVVEAREADFRLLAEASSDMVSRIGFDGQLIYVSPSAVRVVGWSAADLIGTPALNGINPDDRPAVDRTVEALRRGDLAEAKLTYRTRHREKGEIWVESSLNVTRDPQTAEIDGVVAVSRDMTEHKELETQLAALATRDGLTGIANRRCFDEVFEAEWLRCQRDGDPVSLLLIDVDQFKKFNDGYGHQSGDECLRRVAVAISQVARRPADSAARYGGEEFALLMPSTDPAGCERMGERVRLAIQELGLAHRGNPPVHVVTVSIGCATVYPSAATPDRSALIEAADMALYAAKRAGRNVIKLAPVVHRLSPATRKTA